MTNPLAITIDPERGITAEIKVKGPLSNAAVDGLIGDSRTLFASDIPPEVFAKRVKSFESLVAIISGELGTQVLQTPFPVQEMVVRFVIEDKNAFHNILAQNGFKVET